MLVEVLVEMLVEMTAVVDDARRLQAGTALRSPCWKLAAYILANFSDA